MLSEVTDKRLKRQTTIQEKAFVKDIYDKELVSEIYI